MDVELNAIKPKTSGISDKYSANLYKYLKKNPQSRVYTPIAEKYSKDTFSAGDVWLGVFHIVGLTGIAGKRLQMILSGENSMNHLMPANREEYVDITAKFFEDYKEIGRCLLDPSHTGWLRYDEGRFTFSENARTCNWCGRTQLKTTTTVCKAVELWEDAK